MPAFDLSHAVDLLSRTPPLLDGWLRELPEPWIHDDEGPDTWSPFDVVGHLIHGEKTDWIGRLEQILEGRGDEPFEPFDRFAMLRESRGKSLSQLLDEFAALRSRNLQRLRELSPGEDELDLPGLHPELGPVTARQLLATWVAHDLSHVAQIARVMAKGYRDQVGPWREYLPILDR